MSFKKFSMGHINAGDREDNPKTGAMICFDTWESSTGWAIRVWHFDPKLEINFIGEGFKQTHRSCVEHEFDSYDEDSPPSIDHCTQIHFEPTGSEGWLEVKIPHEDMWEPAKVVWGDGVLTDFYENKADLTLVPMKGGVSIEVVERLTDKEKRHYAMSNRLSRLRGIAREVSWDLERSIMLDRYEIMDSVEAEDYEEWLNKKYNEDRGF
tara:strand:+ start:164 stop:790 length:627 start_codon:yes stop_codon:yes gene_type:complete